MRPPRRGLAIELLLVVGATIHAAVSLRRAPAWTVDDAWIVCRYAENLAQHGTLAWNLDGPRVEGFTSLSSVLVAALVTALHLPPMMALVLLGEIAYLASGALIFALGRALRAPPVAAGLVAVAHMTLAEHLTHATSGLETEPFIALGLGLALATARALRGGSARTLAIVAFVLAMTRPEGVLASALALAGVAYVRREATRTLAAWFVAPVAVVLVWRVATFGVPVPNTYFAKRAPFNVAHLRDLWTLVNQHFVDLVVVAGACIAIARSFRVWRRERLLVLLALAVLAAHSLAYARSEPLMDYARRFAMHDLAWLDVLALVAVSAGLRALPRAPRVLAALAALAIVVIAKRGTDAEAAEALRTSSYARAMQDVVTPAADWILAHTPPDATIAVYPDAGWLPYRTKRRTIDFGLLNDPVLARSHAPDVVDAYFFRLQPDVLVAARPEAGKLYDDGAEAIVHDPRFLAGYTLVLERSGRAGSGYLVYARNAR